MPDRKPMTKAQLTKHFAETFGMPKPMAADLIAEFAELAVKETKEAGSFSIPGIGKLVLSHRKARKARNPRTGETIDVPAKTVAKARLSKVFKEAVMK